VSVLLAGLGAVGTRAARQLVDTPGVERLLVADLDDRRAEAVASAIKKSFTSASSCLATASAWRRAL